MAEIGGQAKEDTLTGRYHGSVLGPVGGDVSQGDLRLLVGASALKKNLAEHI
jgi:hypothetical protein